MPNSTNARPSTLPKYVSSKDEPRDLYLEIVKRSLLCTIYPDSDVRSVLNDYTNRKASIIDAVPQNAERRAIGADAPSQAHSMIGAARMDNIRDAVEYVLENKIPGDFLETGVWRGGACIFMCAILAARGVRNRTVWAADSFDGLPPPNPELYPADAGDEHYNILYLAVSLEEVQSNFAKYDLLDDHVRFLKGWFKDTLPTAPIDRLAILRLDGDMYESTIDAIKNMYHRVSPGGVVIVDDYNTVKGCQLAIDDFRKDNGIDAPIHRIDLGGVYWIA